MERFLEIFKTFRAPSECTYGSILVRNSRTSSEGVFMPKLVSLLEFSLFIPSRGRFSGMKETYLRRPQRKRNEEFLGALLHLFPSSELMKVERKNILCSTLFF